MQCMTDLEVIRWRSAGMGPAQRVSSGPSLMSAEVVVLLALGPWLIDRIGVSGAAMISGASGVVRWGTAGLTANAPVMAMVEPLHGFTFALLHLVCMRVLGDIVPERLAATAQNVYGSVIVGGAVTMMTFVSGPLYDHFGAKAFWFMAALCAAAIPLSAKLKVSGFARLVQPEEIGEARSFPCVRRCSVAHQVQLSSLLV